MSITTLLLLLLSVWIKGDTLNTAKLEWSQPWNFPVSRAVIFTCFSNDVTAFIIKDSHPGLEVRFKEMRRIYPLQCQSFQVSQHLPKGMQAKDELDLITNSLKYWHFSFTGLLFCHFIIQKINLIIPFAAWITFKWQVGHFFHNSNRFFKGAFAFMEMIISHLTFDLCNLHLGRIFFPAFVLI